MVKQDSSDIRVFDRAQILRNRARSRQKFKNHSFLHEWANARLAERLEDVTRSFETGLHIGPILPGTQKVQHYFRMDMMDADLIADEEFLPFANQSLDLVTSTMALHMVNDLPGALLQIKRALKPDGLFVAVMPGGETLHELRHSLMEAELSVMGGVSPRVYPFADKQQMGALLQRAGFTLPVVDSEMVTATYENIFKLFGDLRGMGQGNAIAERSRKHSGKSLFLKAGDLYQSKFAESNGRIPATFEMIFLIGWAPHKSQQKPLRPGSAQNRLADVLKTDEIKL